MKQIPVIDLFAGPGGLGEGFSAYSERKGGSAFRIALSIEKDPLAHKTLELRAFFRQFDRTELPAAYYKHIRGELRRSELFALYPKQAARAAAEAWLEELGPASAHHVEDRIRAVLSQTSKWVLIGGPPCQAYSLAGRSRNRGVVDYLPASDKRQTLYVEYLQILADHGPPVFVMENVKGLLSAQLGSRGLFDRILQDLSAPSKALQREGRSSNGRPQSAFRYSVHPVVHTDQRSLISGPEDFVVRTENHGIPQSRHRVILLGVRHDLNQAPSHLDQRSTLVNAGTVLSRLPRIRSGITGNGASEKNWVKALRDARSMDWFKWLRNSGNEKTLQLLRPLLDDLAPPARGMGAEFIPWNGHPSHEADWYRDDRIGGILNHSGRLHMESDLHRYLFASAYANAEGRSPELAHFPPDLLPAHRNVRSALAGGTSPIGFESNSPPARPRRLPHT